MGDDPKAPRSSPDRGDRPTAGQETSVRVRSDLLDWRAPRQFPHSFVAHPAPDRSEQDRRLYRAVGVSNQDPHDLMMHPPEGFQVQR